MGIGFLTARVSIAAIAIPCALAACSHPGVQFSTTLGAPDGLGSGDPVTHAGSRIGQVTGVRSSLYQSPTVNFEVDQNDWGLVHTDSIMVLQEPGGSPALELDNPNPMSPVAPAGSQLPGASSQAEADAIRMSRGLGSYAMGLAQFMGSVSNGPNPRVNPAVSAAIMAQMLAIQQQAALAAYANSPQARQQVYQLAQQLQAVQQQLQQAGQIAQAMQLRQQIEQLLRATATPPPPPNTRVYPK